MTATSPYLRRPLRTEAEASRQLQLVGTPTEWKRRQQRHHCAKCGAEWWHTPGSAVDPKDHARPDGRRCLASRIFMPVSL